MPAPEFSPKHFIPLRGFESDCGARFEFFSKLVSRANPPNHKSEGFSPRGILHSIQLLRNTSGSRPIASPRARLDPSKPPGR
jgi:hypothetical protein